MPLHYIHIKMVSLIVAFLAAIYGWPILVRCCLVYLYFFFEGKLVYLYCFLVGYFRVDKRKWSWFLTIHEPKFLLWTISVLAVAGNVLILPLVIWFLGNAAGLRACLLLVMWRTTGAPSWNGNVNLCSYITLSAMGMQNDRCTCTQMKAVAKLPYFCVRCHTTFMCQYKSR